MEADQREENFALSSKGIYSSVLSSWAMDKSTQEALLKLRQRFITEDGFSGKDYVDGIDALLPDRSSSAWEKWTAHGNALLSAYETIVKDGKAGEWPAVRASCPASSCPLIMINAAASVLGDTGYRA